jgi:hypothetical protein
MDRPNQAGLQLQYKKLLGNQQSETKGDLPAAATQPTGTSILVYHTVPDTGRHIIANCKLLRTEQYRYSSTYVEYTILGYTVARSSNESLKCNSFRYQNDSSLMLVWLGQSKSNKMLEIWIRPNQAGIRGKADSITPTAVCIQCKKLLTTVQTKSVLISAAAAIIHHPPNNLPVQAYCTLVIPYRHIIASCTIPVCRVHDIRN